MIFLLAHIIVPMMVFMIPIIAILSVTYLKAKRMDLEAGKKNIDDESLSALKKQLLYLEAEQERLEKRLEQLEKSPNPQGLPLSELERLSILQDKSKK